MKNPKVDKYLIDGCMRCNLGATPDCKVNRWREELILLRQIVSETGLTEDLKWGMPCYTFENKNVVMLSAFKEYTSVNFFKGTLLNDTENILQKPGDNSQSVRLLKYTDIKQIIAQEEHIKTYILQALEIEKTGKKVEFKKTSEPLPSELTETFKKDPGFEKSFYALTPGRQRGYLIYFSQPKQSQSRLNRIEKYRPNIMNGEGLHDKYKC